MIWNKDFYYILNLHVCQEKNVIFHFENFLDRIGKYKTTELSHGDLRFTEKVTFILFSVHSNSLNDFYLFRINEIEQIWSLKESTEVFLIKILCALCGEIFLDNTI